MAARLRRLVVGDFVVRGVVVLDGFVADVPAALGDVALHAGVEPRLGVEAQVELEAPVDVGDGDVHELGLLLRHGEDEEAASFELGLATGRDHLFHDAAGADLAKVVSFETTDEPEQLPHLDDRGEERRLVAVLELLRADVVERDVAVGDAVPVLGVERVAQAGVVVANFLHGLQVRAASEDLELSLVGDARRGVGDLDAVLLEVTQFELVRAAVGHHESRLDLERDRGVEVLDLGEEADRIRDGGDVHGSSCRWWQMPVVVTGRLCCRCTCFAGGVIAGR